ncbi:hypothetical protein FQN50_007046 [Emmonsiellopsis sp. PD_5]|nr:hypothetical protein FQN50_007046 [Emmonsiellopsis sp. PD_5]
MHFFLTLPSNQMNHLSSILAANHHANKSSDLFFGIRCFSLDTITSLCFARPVNALNTPNFRHPIIEAMVVSLPTFVVLKHFSRIRKAVMGLPHWLSIKMNPSAAGLIHLQQMLQKQVNEVCTNPKILDNSPHTTIYHALLNPGSYKGGKLPPPSALYDEAQAMVSGGTETVGTAITWGIFHVLERKDVLERLRAELLEAWPDLNAPPRLQGLEKLPYLAVVGMCASFVHNSETIFEKPLAFNPDRWLSNTQQLETWFVPFSKGPRSCFGVKQVDHIILP